jgi:hypothetical protein
MMTYALHTFNANNRYIITDLARWQIQDMVSAAALEAAEQEAKSEGFSRLTVETDSYLYILA